MFLSFWIWRNALSSDVTNWIPGTTFLTELVFSPITYLYQIARFGLLSSLYGEVVIPR